MLSAQPQRPRLYLKRFDLIAFPFMLIVGFIVSNLHGIFPILVWLDSMIFHETGHALSYWLNGQVAIPSFGATLPLQRRSSLLTFIVCGIIAGIGFRYAKRRGYYFLATLSVGFILLSSIFTLLLSTRMVEAIILFSGLGGEMYLATIALVAFFQPMPQYLKWDINRFLVLAISSISLSQAVVRWYRARSDASQIPMGALFDFGTIFGGESNGDLNRLMREFGWSSNTIVSTYYVTGLMCLAVLFLYYAFLVLLSKKSQEISSSQL